MKIFKIFNNLLKTQTKVQNHKKIPNHPIIYDRTNVTKEEFSQYVKYLAENNINKTFIEPDRFITQAEKKQQQIREKELQEYREFVHNLAKNNINRTFWQ